MTLIKIIKEYFIIRNSHLFDERYYLMKYPDIRRADVHPLHQFVLHGSREGRNPAQGFDTRDYLNLYPDVERSGMNPLVHYLRYGSKAEHKSLPDENHNTP